MEQQTQHLAQNTAASLSQAMMPLMQAFQQMASTQDQLQQNLMQQQVMLNQVMVNQGYQMPMQPGVETVNIASDDEEMRAGWAAPDRP